MVLLLCLWENLKKWSSDDEMREPYHHYYHQGGGGGDHHKPYPPEHHPYHQMGGLRRLETGTIRTHFYPEGGWGWIVCACAFLAHVTTSGAQLSAGALHIVLANKFQDSTAHHWLGPLSWSVSSVFSPLVVNLCRRKNVRVLSLVGGILFPLSLLGTSFATEIQHIFICFGLFGGIGSCMVRESSGVVLGEFFRKRRQFVEQVVMAGTGVGVTLFSLLYLSFTRHLEWGAGFRVGAAFATICVLLPAFYRTASKYQPRERSGSLGGSGGKHQRVESPKSPSSMVVPLGGDICRSLHLFCVPSLKPLLWSSAISSFGLYAPVFLMSDFGRSEGLSGGSLLLLQTHLGLGLSLGVILGAILTLKKFKSCRLSPRVLCTGTACLTGASMIAISSVKGYYGYSLSAWVYGVALGSHLYTLKVLTMELTRTKHWGRIWSCVQSLMSPGILLGSGLTSYAGKSGFYACATAVFIGAGLVGFQLIDMTKCSSPQLSSSADTDSPIPPAPPPISLAKYGHQATPLLSGGVLAPESATGLYPLRRSISLQQPVYPCCPEVGAMGGMGMGLGYGLGGYPPGYSPYCRECVLSGSPLPPAWGMYYQPTPTGSMIRSYSLPQTAPIPAITGSHHSLKSTGTQTNPNSPVRTCSRGTNGQISIYPGSYDRLPTLPGSFLPPDRVIRDGDSKLKSSTASQQQRGPPTTTTFREMTAKNTVMFASNPQLFPASATQSSATSTTDQSGTPTTSYAGNGKGNNGNNHHFHSHNHPHTHTQHNHRHPSNGIQQQQEADRDSSPNSRQSPRHYYPQREERRANFIRGHKGPIVDQGQKQQSQPFQQQQQQRFYAPQTTMTTTVETHKKPEKPAVVSSINEKQQPAFTRHYFDSSKIQKGSAARSNATNIFSSNGGGGGGTSGPSTSGTNAPTTKGPHQHHHHTPTTTTSTNVNVISSSVSTTAQGGQFFIPFQQTPTNAQQQQQLRQSQQQPSLPISVSAVNAKLQQYQRQQQQQQQQQQEEFDWRSIQRQSASTSNPFEDDPDPPYYPATAGGGISHAHHQQSSRSMAKVSGNEFDIEQPKFNSLRKSLSRSGQNSSMSSQLNYSVTPTPVHQHHHHHPHSGFSQQQHQLPPQFQHQFQMQGKF
ncbi:uncharacterized protein LOC118436541 isoform X3 [Folsomia candida]|nr:uncharacterized protein LOC118436541 isoform X3 [Folsomia candida]